MTTRFLPPFEIIEHPESFEIRDAAGRCLSFTYFEDNETRRFDLKRMTREEALTYVRWVCWAAEKSAAWKAGTS